MQTNLSLLMEEAGKWKQFGLYSSKKLLTESTNRYTKKENHLRQGLYFKNRSAELRCSKLQPSEQTSNKGKFLWKFNL